MLVTFVIHEYIMVDDEHTIVCVHYIILLLAAFLCEVLSGNKKEYLTVSIYKWSRFVVQGNKVSYFQTFKFGLILGFKVILTKA